MTSYCTLTTIFPKGFTDKKHFSPKFTMTFKIGLVLIHYIQLELTLVQYSYRWSFIAGQLMFYLQVHLLVFPEDLLVQQIQHKFSIISCMMLCQNLVKSALSMMFRPRSCVNKQSRCQETCSECTDGGGEVGMHHNAHWHQTAQKSDVSPAVSELSHVIYR